MFEKPYCAAVTADGTIAPMTERETDTAIGKLIRKYESNEQQIASLLEEIAAIQETFERVADWLTEPFRVWPAGSADEPMLSLSPTVHRHETSRSIDMERLKGLLKDLHAARKCKERMEGNLRRAGLARVIRE